LRNDQDASQQAKKAFLQERGQVKIQPCSEVEKAKN